MKAVSRKFLSLVLAVCLCLAMVPGIYAFAASVWSWMYVGSQRFAAMNYTSMAIDSNDTPYVAFGDGGNSNKAAVMKYTAASGWETVGSADFSTGSEYSFSTGQQRNALRGL